MQITFPLLIGLSLLPEPVSPTDLYRFPGRQATADVLAFQAEHIHWLECRRGWDVLYRDELGDWLREAEGMREPWRMLDNAHSYHGGRLRYLAELRDAIGGEAYRDGVMPDPVPTRFFQELE